MTARSLLCLVLLRILYLTYSKSEDVTKQHFCKIHTLRNTPSLVKSLRSGNIGSKSTEFVMGLDPIATFAHTLNHLRGSKLQ